jgi:hypothetical protein
MPPHGGPTGPERDDRRRETIRATLWKLSCKTGLSKHLAAQSKSAQLRKFSAAVNGDPWHPLDKPRVWFMALSTDNSFGYESLSEPAQNTHDLDADDPQRTKDRPIRGKS